MLWFMYRSSLTSKLKFGFSYKCSPSPSTSSGSAWGVGVACKRLSSVLLIAGRVLLLLIPMVRGTAGVVKWALARADFVVKVELVGAASLVAPPIIFLRANSGVLVTGLVFTAGGTALILFVFDGEVGTRWTRAAGGVSLLGFVGTVGVDTGMGVITGTGMVVGVAVVERERGELRGAVGALAVFGKLALVWPLYVFALASLGDCDSKGCCFAPLHSVTKNTV